MSAGSGAHPSGAPSSRRIRGFELADTAMQLHPQDLRTDALTGLIASVYASHEGLAQRVCAFDRAALAAGDHCNATLARLIRADMDNRSGRGAEGIQIAQHLAERLANPDLLIANLNNWAWHYYANGPVPRHSSPAR